jgi:hypothetical protein
LIGKGGLEMSGSVEVVGKGSLTSGSGEVAAVRQVALWRYLAYGEMPVGAQLKPENAHC